MVSYLEEVLPQSPGVAESSRLPGVRKLLIFYLEEVVSIPQDFRFSEATPVSTILISKLERLRQGFRCQTTDTRWRGWY